MTAEPAIDLRPCPFCKRTPSNDASWHAPHCYITLWIRRDTQFFLPNPGVMERAWNTRPMEAALAADVARLTAELAAKHSQSSAVARSDAAGTVTDDLTRPCCARCSRWHGEVKKCMEHHDQTGRECIRTEPAQVCMRFAPRRPRCYDCEHFVPSRVEPAQGECRQGRPVREGFPSVQAAQRGCGKLESRYPAIRSQDAPDMYFPTIGTLPAPQPDQEPDA